MRIAKHPTLVVSPSPFIPLTECVLRKDTVSFLHDLDFAASSPLRKVHFEVLVFLGITQHSFYSAGETLAHKFREKFASDKGIGVRLYGAVRIWMRQTYIRWPAWGRRTANESCRSPWPGLQCSCCCAPSRRAGRNVGAGANRKPRWCPRRSVSARGLTNGRSDRSSPTRI